MTRMSRTEDLVNRIVEIEWEMFQNVPNIGGRASCQEDAKTFRIMRSSQGLSWSEAALESYLADLHEAEREGRNLLTEKYARMMKSTAPMEYARMEHLLPGLSPEVLHLIDEIMEIVLEWEEELSRRYPYLVKRGRPIRSAQDKGLVTSLETYMRGELATYSERTLRLLLETFAKQRADNVNGSETVLHHMVRQYGYGSAEEANRKLETSDKGPQ